MQLLSPSEFATYETPTTHFLQTALWGQLKSRFHWKPLYALVEGKYPVLILERILPMQIKLWYVPKGPGFLATGAYCDTSVRELQSFAREQQVTCLRIEPEVMVSDGAGVTLETQVVASLRKNGFVKSPRNIQFKGTMLIDLTLPEDQLFASFKEKMRYNIKLAQRKGVVVTTSHEEADLLTLYDLFCKTGVRKGFRANPWPYYKHVWSGMVAAGHAEVFFAKHEDDTLGVIMPYVFGERGWYVYNADTGIKRNLMATPYLLWSVMQWLKAQGVKTFDLWGIPVTNEQSDSFSGVLRFKRGFSGQEVQWLGCFDYYPNPTWQKWFGKFERVYAHWLWHMKRELVW